MADPYFKRSPTVLKKSDAYSFGIVLYTMLVGRFPAFGSKGLKFPAEAELSNDAKDLLKRLTEKNYIMRLSLHDALSHPWVTGEAAPDIPLKNTVINGLKNYRFMNVFQRAIVNIVSNRLTDEDKLALREAFTALDINGDGKLDLGEISKLFQDHKKQLGLETDKAALERAKSLYIKMDHNNDGAVDVEEFMEVQVLGSLLGKDSELQMDLKTLFNVIDVNNDGDISVDEFAAFMANFQPQEVQSIFNSADRDQSGTINFEEFMSAMSGYVQSNTIENSRTKISNAVDVIKKSYKRIPDQASYSAPEEKEDENDRLLATKA
jgi:Ca2+-binding EF-hand superfamily protein